MRRRARHQRQLSTGVDSQQAALVWAEAGEHDVRSHPDPEQAALSAAGALGTLQMAPRGVVG